MQSNPECSLTVNLFRAWSDMKSCILEGDRIKFGNLFERRVWDKDGKKKSSETIPEFEELYRQPCGLVGKMKTCFFLVHFST